MTRLLAALDTFGHLPIAGRLMPRFVHRWACDHYESALGVTPSELRRTAC